MRRAATGAVIEPSLSQWAEQVEQGVRELVHRTRPAPSELTGPPEAGEVLAVLAVTIAMLPQLCDQLADWLHTEQARGRLRLDGLAAAPDVAHAVHAATGALEHAAACAGRAASAFDRAHQRAAHLAPTEDIRQAEDAHNGQGSAGWSA